MSELVVKPIGFISTPYHDKYEAPRQPGVGPTREGVITLWSGLNFEQALCDLEGFDRIWLLYWFDRNPNWKPKILTPRSGMVKRGLFSTRSPHRPNPIGMSVVDLLEIKGRTVRVGNVDLLDGTPILDIKPYLPYADSYPDSKIGWVEVANDRTINRIVWSELAELQVTWLKTQFEVDLRPRTVAVLTHNSTRHPYQRISENDEGFSLAIRSWRIDFEKNPDKDEIRVIRVRSGYNYPDGAYIRPLDRDAHVAFHLRWPVAST